MLLSIRIKLLITLRGIGNNNWIFSKYSNNNNGDEAIGRLDNDDKFSDDSAFKIEHIFTFFSQAQLYFLLFVWLFR